MPTSADPFVDPAGTVIRAVLPPLENTTAVSSAPESGVNVNVNVTTTSTGYAFPSDTVNRGCCAGADVSVTPAKFSGGVAGRLTAIVTAFVAVVPALSRAVTVTL